MQYNYAKISKNHVGLDYSRQYYGAYFFYCVIQKFKNSHSTGANSFLKIVSNFFKSIF